MQFWEMAYKLKWATKDDLKKAVEKGLITVAGYKEITGEDIPTAE